MDKKQVCILLVGLIALCTIFYAFVFLTPNLPDNHWFRAAFLWSSPDGQASLNYETPIVIRGRLWHKGKLIRELAPNEYQGPRQLNLKQCVKNTYMFGMKVCQELGCWAFAFFCIAITTFLPTTVAYLTRHPHTKLIFFGNILCRDTNDPVQKKWWELGLLVSLFGSSQRVKDYKKELK